MADDKEPREAARPQAEAQPDTQAAPVAPNPTAAATGRPSTASQMESWTPEQRSQWRANLQAQQSQWLQQQSQGPSSHDGAAVTAPPSGHAQGHDQPSSTVLQARPPPIPPRLPHPVKYDGREPQRASLYRQAATVPYASTLWLSGSIPVIAAILINVLWPLWTQAREAYMKILHGRRDSLMAYLRQVLQLCRLYASGKGPTEYDGDKTPTPESPKLITSTKDSPLPSSVHEYHSRVADKLLALQSALTRLTDKVNSPDHAIPRFRIQVDELIQIISRETYMGSTYARFHTYSSGPWSTLPAPEAGLDSAADPMSSMSNWSRRMNDLKGEIRSVKGLMLSRANFPIPKAATMNHPQ